MEEVSDVFAKYGAHTALRPKKVICYFHFRKSRKQVEKSNEHFEQKFNILLSDKKFEFEVDFGPDPWVNNFKEVTNNINDKAL